MRKVLEHLPVMLMYFCFVITQEFMIRIYLLLNKTLKKWESCLKFWTFFQIAALLFSEVLLDLYYCRNDITEY